MRRDHATGFFRDAHMPSSARDRYAHERFQLDTLADRRAPDRTRRRPVAWVRSMLTRAFKL